VNVLAVMESLGDALGRIEGLRVSPYWADRVTPPWAIVEMPEEVTYDATMVRGGDELTATILVGVGRADARSACAQLAAYLDGAGASSVKAAVDTHRSAAFDSARVVSAKTGDISVANVAYLGATFTVTITGQGA
jgi:signal recognition particle GTPase